MKNEDTDDKTLDATTAQNNETATGVTEERKKRTRVPRIWESNAKAVVKIIQRNGDDHSHVRCHYNNYINCWNIQKNY